MRHHTCYVESRYSTDEYRWTTLYCTNAVFVLYIAIMKCPSRWSCDMDLALMKSIGHCQQQNSKTTPVLGNFKHLLQSLCSAVDTVRKGVAAPTDVELHSDIRSDLHSAPMASENNLSTSKGGQLLSSQGNGRTDIETSEHANVFPDAFDASNIQF